jgi:L-ascorbate metabolism protein UlaG (beta-lactamase superfamily)
MKIMPPGPDIVWLGHDTFKISDQLVIYTDPYQLEVAGQADIVLVTHIHGDHCSPADIAKLSKPGMVIVAPAECQDKLRGYAVQIVKPGDRVMVKGIAIEAVAAYNVNKFRSPGVPFHPQADGKLGFIVTIGGRRIYHAGDTDLIPEMSAITCDIALLPVSGTYTMTAPEAAEAAGVLKPALAIPMHYGVVAGSASDAETFKKLAPVPVAILTKGV